MSSPADRPRLPPLPLTRLSERVLGWFIPRHVRRDTEELRRARIVVTSSLVLVAVDLLTILLVDWYPGETTAFGIEMPRPVVLLLLFAALVHFSIAFTVKRTGALASSAFFLPASLVVFFTALALDQGGFDSPVSWLLAAVPMFSAFLSGPRSTLVSASLVLADLFLLYWLFLQGFGPGAAPTPAEAIAAQDTLRGQVLLLGFLAFFGWYYERVRTDSGREIMSAYTALERTNQALRISQLNVRQIAENIGHALWMHDIVTGRVVYANPAFEQVFHLSRTRLEADPHIWRERVRADDHAQVPTVPDGSDHTYRILSGDEERWVQHAVYDVEDADADVHRAVHIASDVTFKVTADNMRERYLERVLEVQENERRHLARELHDNTGQSLTALLVGLRALSNTLDGDALDMVQMLREQLREVVTDIGRLARGLHPSALDELGLSAAIGRLADDARDGPHGVTVQLTIGGAELEDDLSPTLRLAVYRIVQEALTNVVRHAEGTRADVDIQLTPTRVSLRVEDDGQGFDPETMRPDREVGSGLGLLSMQERATLLGGSVAIESAEGRGTTVLGTLPVRGHASTDT